jgi:hypothetical protein
MVNRRDANLHGSQDQSCRLPEGRIKIRVCRALGLKGFVVLFK